MPDVSLTSVNRFSSHVQIELIGLIEDERLDEDATHAAPVKGIRHDDVEQAITVDIPHRARCMGEVSIAETARLGDVA